MTKQRSRKIKANPDAKLARGILTESQVIRGDFMVVDVQNRTEADQRGMVRSGQTKTVRRTTKIDQMKKAGILSTKQADVCEWFKDQHTRGYEAGQGTTARYGESSGAGGGNHSHLPRDLEQQHARLHFAFARAGVEPLGQVMLDRVLIDDKPIGRLGSTFRTAVEQLVERVQAMGVAT